MRAGRRSHRVAGPSDVRDFRRLAPGQSGWGRGVLDDAVADYSAYLGSRRAAGERRKVLADTAYMARLMGRRTWRPSSLAGVLVARAAAGERDGRLRGALYELARGEGLTSRQRGAVDDKLADLRRRGWDRVTIAAIHRCLDDLGGRV